MLLCKTVGAIKNSILTSIKICVQFLNFSVNHDDAEISVIWLVKGSTIKLLVLISYYVKTNFEVHRNFSANTLFVALFETCFRSLFFDLKKRRQCSEVTARSFITDLFKMMLSGCIAIGIRWWLILNHMISHAINNKFDFWWLKKLNFSCPKDSKNYDTP